MALPAKIKERLEESSAPTIYGCCGLFDLCGDRDLMSLSFQGSEHFLDWLGWRSSIDCIIRKDFIAWTRPVDCGYSHAGDPCAERVEVEYGVCDWEIRDFGRYGHRGPVRDVSEAGERLCDKQPRYRLDGTQIVSDAEYDLTLIVENILGGLKTDIVVGNIATAGQFDGLEQLVRTGYMSTDGSPCSLMDSILIDWNMSTMGDEAAGKTWNGNAIPAGFNLVDVIRAAVRRTRQRMSWSPPLARQPLAVGNMVIVAPTELNGCLLDQFTCWSVCDGDSDANIQVALQSFEARRFRNDLNGGMFNAGRIYIDQMEIPLINYDWGLIKGPSHGDIYILVNAVGAMKTMHGEWLDQSRAVVDYPEDYTITDAGKFLLWLLKDETCARRSADMRPRLINWAPWLQTRIQDVVCRAPGGWISPDPCETSFFPQTSFVVPSCAP